MANAIFTWTGHNRCIRRLWGAFEQLRAAWAAAVPPDPVQQIDTSALPVKHPSRVRGPDGWTGPGNDLAARFGRDGAHAEWFYGFRLAIRTDLGRRIVRAWSIVPAAVDERRVGTDLVAGDAVAIDALLQDKGFTGRRFAAEMAGAGIEVIIPPTRAQRATMARTLQRLIARLRNRVETSFKEITDQMELARHGAHTFEGLLTRTAAALAAHTLLLTELLSDAELVCLAARRYCRASLAADLLRPARAPVPVPSENSPAITSGSRRPRCCWLR